MSARVFKDRADYVSIIIESAQDILKKDPEGSLKECVTFNITGGYHYWGDQADEIYNNPKNHEEGLLALELRSVLERAITNECAILFDKAHSRKSEPWVSDWIPVQMEALLLDMMEKLTVRNPVMTIQAKILANKIAETTSDTGFVTFVSRRGLCNIPEQEVCSHT